MRILAKCYRVFLVPPLKVLSTKKLTKARLGVSRAIYVSVDSPNLGFPYFNFLGGCSEKNHPVQCTVYINQYTVTANLQEDQEDTKRKESQRARLEMR